MFRLINYNKIHEEFYSQLPTQNFFPAGIFEKVGTLNKYINILIIDLKKKKKISSNL